MEQFELCYIYGLGKTAYIVPDLLPKELEEEPKFFGKPPLRFVMKYDYLPSSIISRVMVRFKNDIVIDQLWRYGMVLKNDEFNCTAKIKSSEQKQTITITIQGEPHNKRDFLAVIRHAIIDINCDFQNMIVNEFVPLPGYPDYMVEYQELLGYEKEGIQDYFQGRLRKSFSVSKMLDRVVKANERVKDSIKGEHVINNYVNNKLNHVANVNSNQVQNVEVTVNIDIKQHATKAQSLFCNLKEDILTEVDIEVNDENEKKRILAELDKTEKAFREVEKAAMNDTNVIDDVTKNRFDEFIDGLQNEDSRINRGLKFVENAADKVKKIARVYNYFAGFFGLPPVPDFLVCEKN